MTFAQIKELAVRQYNLDTEDLPDVEPDVSGYVNDGYNRVNQRHYKPWRTDTVAVDGPVVPFASLSETPTALVRVANARISARMNEAEQVIELPAGVSISTVHVDIAYYYLPAPMEDAVDEPELPEWVHPYLADYATWLLYRNGNISKQNRGQAFLARFEEAMRRLKPFGSDRLGGQFFGLYAPNLMV